MEGFSIHSSGRRHTHCRPSRLTFTAPIERSAVHWLTIWNAVGLPPAWTILGRHHLVSCAVVASPSNAAKQYRAPRCNGPPRAGPRQRRRFILKFPILPNFQSVISWTEINGGSCRKLYARMKMKRDHAVPLSAAAMRVIEYCAGIRHSAYVFPGQRQGRPLSETVMRQVLKQMGHDVTVHGFRSSLSTWRAERTPRRWARLF
jgi:hypothetical protein